MNARTVTRVFAVVSALLGAACSSSSSSGTPTASTPTYFQDVKPIVDAKCTGCHVQGGLAPFPLTAVGEVTPHASAMKGATGGRIMPPWMAAPGCQSYQGDESLTDAQIATIAAWADAGAPPGDPANPGAPLATDKTAMSRVDVSLSMPAPYTPAVQPDDYHCFLLDWAEATTKYVTGFRARAGDSKIVHHVIAYLAAPSAVAQYDQLNAGGKGWTCFGGPGGSQTGGASWLGAWAPGGAGGDFPEGTGIEVAAGSKIILQVHYNTLVTTGSDQTSLDFKVDDTVQKKAAIVPYADPSWLQGGMQIAAGNPDATYSWSFDISPYMSLLTNGAIPNGSFLLYSTSLHMHLLGTKAHTSITPAGGGQDECLLDIPSWNFHWQRLYSLTQPVKYNAGDKLNLDCHWNNSQANQPVVNGQQSTPRNLAWGEGTTDEMCLGLMYVTGQ